MKEEKPVLPQELVRSRPPPALLLPRDRPARAVLPPADAADAGQQHRRAWSLAAWGRLEGPLASRTSRAPCGPFCTLLRGDLGARRRAPITTRSSGVS